LCLRKNWRLDNVLIWLCLLLQKNWRLGACWSLRWLKNSPLESTKQWPSHLAFPPAVEELRPPVVDAHHLLHLLERRVRAHVVMERQRKAFARVLTAVLNKSVLEQSEKNSSLAIHRWRLRKFRLGSKFLPTKPLKTDLSYTINVLISSISNQNFPPLFHFIIFFVAFRLFILWAEKGAIFLRTNTIISNINE
jgi:hypothetical protein